MAINTAMTAENNRGGSGRGYVPMRQGKNGNKKYVPNYKKDARMRFKNSKDPVYVAFDFIDNQSISQLAVDFVKDSIFDIMQFVNNVKSVMK